jgi:glucosamine 6-phosphate synthetase-like amidotransferase/phosphosugar isomerase protein
MCGLFGFLRYGEAIKKLSTLTNSLAEQSAIRGTDATGIAFNEGGKLKIIKDGKSAYELDFKHSDDTRAMIGHTRHSTQGSEKKNCNNHPFPGRVGNLNFALAHNGVLSNDDTLRKTLNLPKTKIETDSYVAAQLLMSKKTLDFESIKYMAEKVCGSFSFSILDSKDNLYLVKGDSPLHVLHFPKSKIYVYASTEAILFKALVDTSLFKELKLGDYEELSVLEGDILKHRLHYLAKCQSNYSQIVTAKSQCRDTDDHTTESCSAAANQKSNQQCHDSIAHGRDQKRCHFTAKVSTHAHKARMAER